MWASAPTSSSQSPHLSISASRRKFRSLPCSSSPMQTHFVGLCIGLRNSTIPPVGQGLAPAETFRNPATQRQEASPCPTFLRSRHPKPSCIPQRSGRRQAPALRSRSGIFSTRRGRCPHRPAIPRRSGETPPTAARGSPASQIFALESAKPVQSVFCDDMRIAKHSSRGAECANEVSARSAAQSPSPKTCLRRNKRSAAYSPKACLRRNKTISPVYSAGGRPPG